MIVNLKFFYEKNLVDHEEYDNLWEENKERFIFLNTNLSLSEQRGQIINYLNKEKEDNYNKDILALRFPTNKFIKKSVIINDIILGKGFKYCDNDNNDKTWHAKEVWIYNQFNI
jgi:hypothetical protein